MKLFVSVSKSFVCYMRIYLGGSNIGMAEKHLDTTEVGAIAQKVGGEAVTDNMRGNFF